MKKTNHITKQNQKGITLIALIITIIVLLILAGITISLTIGQRGIITRAQEAGVKSEEATAREKLELALVDLQADKVTNPEYNENEYIDSYLSNEQMVVMGDIVLVDGWQFRIDRSVPKIAIALGKGEEVEEQGKYLFKDGKFGCGLNFENFNQELRQSNSKKFEIKNNTIYREVTTLAGYTNTIGTFRENIKTEDNYSKLKITYSLTSKGSENGKYCYCKLSFIENGNIDSYTLNATNGKIVTIETEYLKINNSILALSACDGILTIYSIEIVDEKNSIPYILQNGKFGCDLNFENTTYVKNQANGQPFLFEDGIIKRIVPMIGSTLSTITFNDKINSHKQYAKLSITYSISGQGAYHHIILYFDQEEYSKAITLGSTNGTIKTVKTDFLKFNDSTFYIRGVDGTLNIYAIEVIDEKDSI